MRRIRYWLIGLVGLAAFVGGSVAFYYKFVDTAYSRAEFYADTGVRPMPKDPGVIAGFKYEEKRGRITLALVRGEPHGIITTDHGWQEWLSIEIPRPSSGERIELNRPDVQLAFGANDGRRFGEVGDGGIRGFVQLESAGESRIVAVYEVTIDACYRHPYESCLRHQDVVFRGRYTFRLRLRPDDEFIGDLWPRPGPPRK